MTLLPCIAALLALAGASASGVEYFSATCGWPIAALAERGGKAGAVADFSRRVLLAEGSPSVQLFEILLLALVWWATFSKVRGRVLALEDRPWFEKAVLRTQESFRKSLRVELDLPEAARNYAQYAALAVQHFAGGLLCLPALLGVLPPEVGSVLTRHGALSEVAWEVMDVCEKAHQRWIKPGGAKGRAEVPDSLLKLVLCHHLMATTMVMPVNAFYSDARGYAALVFALQGAAALSLAVNVYIFSSDMNEPSQLFRMRALAVFQVVFVLITRGVLFTAGTFDLLRSFHSDGAAVFLALSVPAVLGMCLINFMFIYDSWWRMQKFLRVSPERQRAQDSAAPAQAPPAARRRRLSTASMAMVDFSAPRQSGFWRCGLSGADPDAAATAEANAAAAAAAAAAHAATEAAKAVSAGEASPRTPDTDVGTSTGHDMDGEDSSDLGASSSGEE